MKQVEQSYRTGELKLVEVPAPRAAEGSLLVATRVSLISSGTEKQLMDLAKASLAGKAMARPDLMRRVVRNVKREGLRPTIDKVFAKLDTPIPLGYSLAGEVLEIGGKGVFTTRRFRLIVGDDRTVVDAVSELLEPVSQRTHDCSQRLELSAANVDELVDAVCAKLARRYWSDAP